MSVTFLVPAPEHGRRCAQCGKHETPGWQLTTAATLDGQQLVCGVGPCQRLAHIRDSAPDTRLTEPPEPPTPGVPLI